LLGFSNSSLPTSYHHPSAVGSCSDCGSHRSYSLGSSFLSCYHAGPVSRASCTYRCLAFSEESWTENVMSMTSNDYGPETLIEMGTDGSNPCLHHNHP
jgi:hypothetical protein